MKKHFVFFLCLAAGLFALTSCSDDDGPNEVTHKFAAVADGALIINEGSYFSGIDGSVSYFDYTKGTVTDNLFSSVNGRSLGGTPNNAIQLGNYVYIAVTEENRIEVAEFTTMAASTPISVTSPRELATDGIYVYVTSYTGKVSKIDPTERKIIATSDSIGGNLEGIAARDGYLYVCNAWNSDYTYNTNVVKLQSSDLKKVKDITVVCNPTTMLTADDDIYVCSMGNYYDVASTVQKIDVNDQVTPIAEATLMAYSETNERLYLINAPYGATPRYFTYDPKTGAEADLKGCEVDYPFAIGFDDVSNTLLITSLTIDSDTGYASYTKPGYLCRYTVSENTCSRTDRVSTGVCPGTLVFVYHTIITN